MGSIAVIGGSGFSDPGFLDVVERESIVTPYGAPSAPLMRVRRGRGEFLYLARHGEGHGIPPHRINYRANIWALREVGADQVIGLAAVGGIGRAYGPGTLAVPDQVIDYTWGREHTFFDSGEVRHVDFTSPYSNELRRLLLRAGRRADLDLVDGGTYGATQGPRLETDAEIARMERDGCDLVGMTGMPEAALARELGVCYACCAYAVNWAAGKGAGDISMSEIESHLVDFRQVIQSVLDALVDRAI